MYTCQPFSVTFILNCKLYHTYLYSYSGKNVFWFVCSIDSVPCLCDSFLCIVCFGLVLWYCVCIPKPQNRCLIISEIYFDRKPTILVSNILFVLKQRRKYWMTNVAYHIPDLNMLFSAHFSSQCLY